MLLDYLADYRHCKQAAGWTLPAFTWWTDQVHSVERKWMGPHMRHDHQTPAIPTPCQTLPDTRAPCPPFRSAQTIGGAVATNSHGSSMKYGSLSSQVGGGWVRGRGELLPTALGWIRTSPPDPPAWTAAMLLRVMALRSSPPPPLFPFRSCP